MKEAKPKLVTCTFLKQWRGHNAGDVADLTEERAEELLDEGTVVRGRMGLPKSARAAAPVADDEAAGDETESTPAKTSAPKRAPANKKK